MRNMHRIDQAIRVVLGLALIWVGFIDKTYITSFWLSGIVGVFGVINIVSAVAAYCPVYRVAGISTAPRD